MKSVGVSGAEGALRSRIADALSQISDEVLSYTYDDGDIDLEGVECLVHLALSDDSDQRNLIDQIGRGSCRERVEIWVIAVSLTKQRHRCRQQVFTNQY